MADHSSHQLNESVQLRIDRCVCSDVTFATMKEWVEAETTRDPAQPPDYEDLRRHFRCGVICGLCRPYLREMLRTGVTTFTTTMPVAERSNDPKDH